MSRTRSGRWLLLATAAGVALLATSCGAIVENATEEAIERGIESEGGGDVEIDFDSDGDGSFTVESEDGTIQFDSEGDGGTITFEGEDGDQQMAFGEGVERPDCLDDAFPVPDGFTSESAMSGDGLCSYGGYVTSGSMEDLAATYEEVLKKLGYTESFSRNTFSSEDSETISMNGQNGDGGYGSVTLFGQEEYYGSGSADPFPAIVITIQTG